MKNLLRTKYLIISYYKDLHWKKHLFRIFKHKGKPFFSKFSKVIEVTLFYHNFIIEF